MKAFAKVAGLVLFGLVILGIGVLFFLTRLFDPNDYKEQIQQLARDKANVELTLGGDIGWSLFPWLGIELQEVTVAPLNQPDQAIAEVGSMGLGVEVLPLLRRQLRMSDVILDSVTLNLLRDADGTGNWETIGATDETPLAEDGSEPAAEQPQESTAGDLDVAIESVRITNASINYTDQQAGQALVMEDVNLTTGALIEGEPFDIDLLGLLIVEDPAVRVRIDLKTVAQFDLDLQRYEFDAINLKVDASGTPFSGRAVNLELQGDGVLDQTAQIAELNQMRLTLADMRATGQVKASQLDGDMQIEGNLDVAEFDGRALIASLGQELPGTTEPRALEKVALSARLDGSATSMMLQDMTLVIDGTTFEGSAGIADFARQAVRFDLSGGSLNVDNYLPAVDEEQQAAAAEPSVKLPSGGSASDIAPLEWSEDPVLPLETLATLDVDGTLSLEELIVSGIAIQPFTFSGLGKDGLVQLRQLEGGVFGGQFSTSGRVDTRATPVELSVKQQLTEIDSLAAQEAFDTPPQIRGLLNVDVELNARGNSMNRWVNTLDGTANFVVNDGALIGVNLEQQLCQGIALANRKTLSEPRGSEDTPFQRLAGSFNITDGTISGSDLVVAVPGIAVKGQGEVDLPDQRIDYRLGLLLQGDKSAMPDPACQINERYEGIEWPVRCQGFLHNAAKSCGVDTEGVARIAGRLLGNEAQRKVEQKLEEKLGDQAPAVRDAIKGLFNR
ncbi:MAG TPA: AsmA family protein [Pseudomonas xinjiangensis]|uniref:AsmA family protein n=2 Tax=root TaxID=1 RepID=A0A7V1FR98_9GAMM|nr:AsmA family protein [Halopseudomonas xinjiangensis]HEC48413.1 AsmA family protein [Halopseudomonas xinjiangensis]